MRGAGGTAFRLSGGLLGAGLVADVWAHATGRARDPRVALAAHLPTFLGMALCTAGLLAAALRRDGGSTGTDRRERRTQMLAAAPQILDQPCCDVINRLPWGFFLAVHVVLFAVGAFLAARSFESGDRGLGWGFTLFALAEVSYGTYHVNITQSLFAHTISEVLDGLAFVVLFAALARRRVVAWGGAPTAGGRIADVGGAR